MSSSFPLLSILIWLPILLGVGVIAAERYAKIDPRWTALVGSIVVFLISLLLYTGFNFETAEMQFVERIDWIAAFGIEYYLGVDGFAVPLIILTTFFMIIVVAAGWEVIKDRAAVYLAAFLIMEGFVVGVFSALDAILFYVFWEAMLIPMFIIIGVWGGPRRVYASIKFFLYTFLGSVFMLIALIYLRSQADSFAVLDFYGLPLSDLAQTLIFLAFFAAFAVKVPMWPVHTWLPDAHVEAPTGGSVILAAIMLKVGGYGFIRFALPIAPIGSMELAWLVILFSLIAVAYIGLVALVQNDMKKLVAYSSIAHMGFVTLGLFIVFTLFIKDPTDVSAALAIQGSMVQMISHGFISGALFLCVGVLYDRMHSRNISDYGGVINKMPIFGAFAVFFAMANAGLPGTSGFVGEFFVILAAVKANFWYAFVASSALIFGAAYTLWMIKRVVFGEVANDNVEKLSDINTREFSILACLAVLVLLFGVWPGLLTDVMEASVSNLIVQLKATPGILAGQ